MPWPVILFGACDRHNLGDLLMPHVAAALLPRRELIVAALAERDLSATGGHRVVALDRLAQQRGGEPMHLWHVGGELLDCRADEAAVMLLTPAEAEAMLGRWAADPTRRDAEAATLVGTAARVPYVVGRTRWPALRRLLHGGVGGVALGTLAPEARQEVLAALRDADVLTVRDPVTQAVLHRHGIEAECQPDPVATIGRLHGARIAAAAGDAAVQALAGRWRGGWLAVQLAREFGDDATLAALAAPLGRWAEDADAGVALFCAGRAPWHDDLETLHRLAARLPPGRAEVVDHADIWVLCALIGASRGFVGTSLHGRIVATALARPRLTLQPRDAEPAKHAAYLARWEAPSLPRLAAPAGLPAALDVALAADPGMLRDHAARLADEALAALGRMVHALP